MSGNSCGCKKKERTPLCHTFPPCPCEKCKLRRACGLMDREQKKQAKQKCIGDCKAAERDFSSFMREVCSIVAFFVIATSIFWLTVSQHLVVGAVKLHRSSRNVKRAAMIFAALLFISLTFKVVRYQVQLKCASRAQARAKYSPDKDKLAKAVGCMGIGKPQNDKKATQRLGGGGDGICSRANQRTKQNVAIPVTDPKAREVFKQSKLYAIPAEMKQPPGILVYLRQMMQQRSLF